MAIDSTAPAPKTDRSCSSSASDTSSAGGEPRPTEKTSGSEAVCLKKLLQNTPPEYLTLWPRPGSAPAAAAYRQRKRPGEPSLAGVDAPRDYLSLSPSENPKRRRGRDYVSGGGGSVVVADASPVASTEGALVLVESVIRPPPPLPLQIPEACLPPKKRKLAAASFALATAVNQSASRSSWPPRDRSGHCPATVASHPIDAVPLQAVYVHGGVSRPFKLRSSAGDITTNETAGGQAKKVP